MNQEKYGNQEANASSSVRSVDKEHADTANKSPEICGLPIEIVKGRSKIRS